MFINRYQAGQLLAGKLIAELEENPTIGKNIEIIVVGLVPGGVLVAEELARALKTELSILVAAKISPFENQPPLAAVSSTGVFVPNKTMEFCAQDFSKFIEVEKHRRAEECRQRERNLLSAAGLKDGVQLKDKLVVLVDEGDSCGLTALAAIRTIRLKGAKQVVLATPVISASTLGLLQPECDLLVCVGCPKGFAHIAQFYEEFHKVDDTEVVAALRSVAGTHTLSRT